MARAAKVIGMPVTRGAVRGRAVAPGPAACSGGDGVLTVTPPPYRFDLTIEEDLIEEVVRIIGYDQLPTTPPLAPITAKLPPEARRSRFAVRRLLAALGYQETINFSFVEESWERDLAGNADPIRLLNPIASQMSVMRSSLLGSLLQALKFNLDRKAERVRVFELGRVFLRDAAVATTDTTVRGIHQPMRVAGLAYGDADGLQWARKGSRRRLLRRQGRRRGPAVAAARRSSSRPSIRPCIPAAAPASGWTAARSAWSANCTRAGASSWELAARAGAVRTRPGRRGGRGRSPAFEPVPKFQPAAARHRGDRGRQRHP